MSFSFAAGPNGPTPTQPAAKGLQVKAVKLTFADFTTGGTAAVKAFLPADASLVRASVYVKTTFAGNGVTALSYSLGITGTVAKYIASTALPAITAGSNSVQFGVLAATTGGFQEWDPTAPGGDIPLLFTGTATTGNPTSGEAYLLIEYVR